MLCLSIFRRILNTQAWLLSSFSLTLILAAGLSAGQLLVSPKDYVLLHMVPGYLLLLALWQVAALGVSVPAASELPG